jgi:hypothetical protein
VSGVPSTHKLGVRRWAPGTKDEFGNVTDTWAAATDWWVRSVDPVSNRELATQNRDPAVIAFAIQADKSPEMPGYRDLVVIDGAEYPVDGAPDDWTKGPWFNPVAGVVVYVRRAEG